MTDRDDKATQALRAIVNLMGNVDHSKPGGPNDAAMRGGMLMDCKAIAQQALDSFDSPKQPEPVPLTFEEVEVRHEAETDSGPKTHLNVGGPRGWSTACGRESYSFVERGSEDEDLVDCKRCLKAMERDERADA